LNSRKLNTSPFSVHRQPARHFVAVDAERGLMFSYIFFDHPAGKKTECPAWPGT
jgi:hypothetical protein